MSSQYPNVGRTAATGDEPQTPAGEYRLLTAAVAESVMLAAMTSTITPTAVAGTPTRLFRYVDGVELPAAGSWHVPGRHADIAFWLPRRLRRTARWRGRAVEATILVGEAANDLHVAVVLDSGLAPATGSSGAAPGSGGRLVAGANSGPLPWTCRARYTPTAPVCRSGPPSATTGCGDGATGRTAGSRWPAPSIHIGAAGGRCGSASTCSLTVPDAERGVA